MIKTLSGFLLVLALVTSGFSQTAKTRAALYTDFDTLFADVGATEITPADVRIALKDITASSYNGLTDGTGVSATTLAGYFADPSTHTSFSPGTWRGDLGGTTLGQAFFLAVDPSAVRYVRINADNTITLRTAAEFLSDIGGGASTWGAITGTLASQTDLQTALDAKVAANAGIIGATKTKITYDAKGLVTAGADATTADIADSSNKRYVTDAQLTVIGNTSGTNSGDQTITLTGDVTGSGTGSFATTIAADAVTFAKLQNIATNSLVGRDTVGTGDAENILLDDTLELDGIGNLQRAALTGDVASTAGSNATTIQADAVALGTDTTGNYVATIADSGASEITVTGSGAESAAVTLAIAATIARDSELPSTFGTVAVSGQSDVVADSTTDTLTLAAGSNITLTTNATTDTLTIAASGGGLGYTLTFTGSNFNPADATTYFTSLGQTNTNSGRRKVYVPKAGTIKVIQIDAYASTAGSGEQIDMYVRVNNTTDTLIASVSAATNGRSFTNTGMSVAVSVGDYLELKMVCPTWVTNPASWDMGGVAYIEQ